LEAHYFEKRISDNVVKLGWEKPRPGSRYIEKLDLDDHRSLSDDKMIQGLEVSDM
jgi:hypothetical protein